MKTIKNLQAEVEKLGNETKNISSQVDMEERIKDIPTLDTENVINKLSNEATIFENCANKFFNYEERAIECNDSRGTFYWNAVAKENQNAAKTIRNTITFIIREQRQTNRIKNILK
jgi:hypothetical protein